MKPAEISLLTSWIDNGMPLGDASKIPATPEYSDGWQIGEPDHVFSCQMSLRSRQTGPWRINTLSLQPISKKLCGFRQPVRPGNWKAVHHIIVYHRPKGSQQVKRLQSLGGFAPGEENNVSGGRWD